jgi:hypothetical protein
MIPESAAQTAYLQDQLIGSQDALIEPATPPAVI